MKKIGVFTSGGDSPGMNAAIRSVVRTAINLGITPYGISRGYKGMVEGDIFEMDAHSVSNILQLGGTILRSARSDAFRTPEGRKKAYEMLKKNGIEGLVGIGGDGTLTGAKVFIKEYPDIRFVGLPGTIDNDLIGTDYTIGYDTAINTAMNAIDKIKDTANSFDRLFFVEVMGRDAGFIALRVGIATGAEAVLIPESKTDINELVHRLRKNSLRRKNSALVIVAEGDDAGGAFEIARQVKEKGFEQYEIRVSVLGHIQRGGSPTCMDRMLASRLGMEAIKALKDGVSGVLVGKKCKDIVYTPFEKAIKDKQKLNPLLLDIVDLLS